jgi:hypothetical protein
VAVNVELLALDPTTYARHALHAEDRAWVESNCYVDLWIEMLHAHGLNPIASLPFTVGLDFEGDQWLFFKQPTADLVDLYGVDIQELNLWRTLLDHTCEQLSRGRLVMVEVDAHYLPDTQGVSYRIGHSKTTIGIQQLDLAAKTLGYFHNAGYYRLNGDDFDAIFRLGRPQDAAELQPYTEFVKLDGIVRRPVADLKARSMALLQKHLARRPRANPVAAFAERFRVDLPWLVGEPQELFHQYAFSTLRQLGSCYELCGSYVQWLEGLGEGGLGTARADFGTLASTAKTMQFKMARAVVLKRTVEFEPMLEVMAAAWERALTTLDARYR